MFSTDFIFRQQENLVDNQKCQAGFRPLCNKIPFLLSKARLAKWKFKVKKITKPKCQKTKNEVTKICNEPGN